MARMRRIGRRFACTDYFLQAMPRQRQPPGAPETKTAAPETKTAWPSRAGPWRRRRRGPRTRRAALKTPWKTAQPASAAGLKGGAAKRRGARPQPAQRRFCGSRMGRRRRRGLRKTASPVPRRRRDKPARRRRPVPALDSTSVVLLYSDNRNPQALSFRACMTPGRPRPKPAPRRRREPANPVSWLGPTRQKNQPRFSTLTNLRFWRRLYDD